MLTPPHPSLSRWSQLRTAVNAFFEEVDDLGMKPRMSLVTWASDYYIPLPFNEYFVATTVDHSINQGSTFQIQRDQILTKLNTLGSQKMVGATNLSGGLNRAIDHITGSQTRPYTNKVIILFTDGAWNEGQHPSIPAARAKEAGVVVHTITLLAGQAFADMQAVANETDGMAFNVTNGPQLRNAFRQIAKNIGVTLID